MGSEPTRLNVKTPSLNVHDLGVNERLGIAVMLGLCFVIVGNEEKLNLSFPSPEVSFPAD